MTEFDFVTANIRIYAAEENINASVNGHPAQMQVLKSPQGHAMTILSWATEKKEFTIMMTGHVQGLGNKNLLVQLASTIEES